jgi:hypothetical protein
MVSTTVKIGKADDVPSARNAIPGTGRRNVAGLPPQTRVAQTTSVSISLDPEESGTNQE